MIKEFKTEDDYPTEKTLEIIRKWNPFDLGGLMEYIEDYFNNYGGLEKRTIDDTYEISTGGWSGCEYIISALKSNTMFWMINWQSSKRGGYFEFKKEYQYAKKDKKV